MATLLTPLTARAQDRLCDPQFEDCRTPIVNLIRQEQQGIDVAFWYMADATYAQELINRKNAGVPVRVLMDDQANNSHPANATILQMLRDAGIPMRNKVGGDILHFKTMLFDGQNVVEFSKANYSDEAYAPYQPNVNYVDEAVFFTSDNRLTNSFRRRLDDLWVDTTQYVNYANIAGTPSRRYSLLPIDPAMNFVPLEEFAARAVPRYDAEPQSMDAIVFRVTDGRLSDAAIRAVARGVPVRLITEPDEYRNPTRLLDAKEIDRMYMGGVQIKIRQHQGYLHEALVVMHGLGEVIFGSSNWTPTASVGTADEHNFFYSPAFNLPTFYQWFVDQFDRKWNDTVNYAPFTPLPPNSPNYSSPGNGESSIGSSVTLTWDGGTWSHLYDIYFGTSSNPPRVATNQELGSPQSGVLETFTVTNLLPGTTYYWRIVDKTWAMMTASGPTWTFTTAGTPPSGGGGGTVTSTPFGGTAAPVPGLIQAENYDLGGTSIAYYDTTAGNKGTAYRGDDVDLGPTADDGGGYYVGWTRAGEWLKYTVNVAATSTYTLETRVANIGTGGRFHVEVDGVDKTGPLTVPDTADWETWQTITTPGLSLTAGQRVIRVVFDTISTSGGVGNYNWFRLVDAASGTAPAAPTTLMASPISQTRVDLAWTDNATNETGFQIERCTGAGCTTFAQISQVGANVTSYSDLTVAASTTYTYRLRAYNGGASSSYSNVATVTTPAASATVPAAPTTLGASPISQTRVDLAWADNATNETGFQVERCTGSSCTTFAQISQVGANVTSYSDLSVVASTTYSYRVRAVNGAGNSGYSNVATATTPAPLVAVQTHVGDLDSSVTANTKGNWSVRVTIVAHDSSHASVAGATVTGSWSGDYSATSSCTTASDGSCSVATGTINRNRSTVTFAVTNVTKTSTTYSAGSNHDPDGDSNGTSITTLKP